MNVVFCPTQIEFTPEIETDGVLSAFTFITIGAVTTESGAAQVAFEVILKVMASPCARVVHSLKWCHPM